MDASHLRHRVTIEAPATVRDDIGGLVDAWTVVCQVWAQIVPLSGREFMAAQAVQSGVAARIKIRHRDGITAGMRVVHAGRWVAGNSGIKQTVTHYNIKAVLPDPSLVRHLTLMCETGVNDG